MMSLQNDGIQVAYDINQGHTEDQYEVPFYQKRN